MSLIPQFGISIDPSAHLQQLSFRLAKIADDSGLNVLNIQDHPYNRRFFETWTLLTALAVSTQRIHVGTNVANLPLRPPAMLAKMAATLDVLTGGRVELGLGAGGFWDAIEAFGGPRRTPRDAYTAFEEALQIMRGLWDEGSFTFNGEFYQVKGARFGPTPAHRIPIWTGAVGPRMMRLTGRLADGLLVSIPYVPPERLLEINQLIDEGAQEAGRSPDEIRRGYNLMGVIDENAPHQPGAVSGGVSYWIEELTRFYHDYRQDTFIFWSTDEKQLETFAHEVVPGVKERLEIGV